MESEWHEMDVQHIKHFSWARNNFLYKMFKLIAAKEKIFVVWENNYWTHSVSESLGDT